MSSQNPSVPIACWLESLLSRDLEGLQHAVTAPFSSLAPDLDQMLVVILIYRISLNGTLPRPILLLQILHPTLPNWLPEIYLKKFLDV